MSQVWARTATHCDEQLLVWTRTATQRDEQLLVWTRTATQRDEQLLVWTRTATQRDEQLLIWARTATQRDEQLLVWALFPTQPERLNSASQSQRSIFTTFLHPCKNSTFDVSSGVLEEFVLGPILFLIYVNDIPEIVNSNAKQCADDTKLNDRTFSISAVLGEVERWRSQLRWEKSHLTQARKMAPFLPVCECSVVQNR